MGESFEKISSVYSGIKTCELNRLNSLNTLKVNLLVGGIAIICVIFLALGIYLILIDKHLNLIWELLRIRAYNSFFELRESIENRLTYIHEKEEINEVDVDSSFLKNKEPLKFKHSLRTIAKFSIIFIIALSFIIIQSFVLESNLQNVLEFHPALSSDRMNRKVLATRITFYVFESRHNGMKPDSLNTLFPYYNTISAPQASVLSMYSELTVLIDKMRDLSIKSLFSSDLAAYSYFSYPSNDVFLTTGTINGLNYFAQESLNFGFNLINAIDSNGDIYYKESQALYDAMSATAVMEDIDLRNLINSQLNDLYSFTGGFGVLFLILYFIYYYPMLAFEIKFLRKIIEIIQIIPKNSNNTTNKSVNKTRARFSS